MPETRSLRPRGTLPPGQLAQVPWTAQQAAVRELARQAATSRRIRAGIASRGNATRRLAEAILATLPPEPEDVIAARCAELERPLPPRVAALLRRGGGPR